VRTASRSTGGVCDDGKLAQAGHRHLQRARDGRCRQRQHVDIGFQRLEPFLVVNAEPLLLVDDDEAEALELDALGEDRVGADDDVDAALRQSLLDRLGLGGGDEAGEAADPEREAVETLDEVRIMLTRKQRRRHHHRHLHPRHRRDEGGPQRHFRLAEADIAADQPVHRLARRQIAQHIVDRTILIVGFLIGEAIDEGGVAARIRLRHLARFQRALGGDGDEFARDLADALLHPRLARLPGDAAQPVEADALGFGAVAREDVDILDRHVKLVATGIAQRHAIMRRGADRDRGQPLISPDAMIGMDDEIARGKRRQLGEEGIGRLAPLRPADEAIAQHVLFGEDGDIRRGKAVIERDGDEGRASPPACGRGLRGGRALVTGTALR
jgi:hypothetical protein